MSRKVVAITAIAGLAAGIPIVVVLSSIFPNLVPSSSKSEIIHPNIQEVSIVTIPQDASMPGNNFEPEIIKVIIGINNTVRWINQDQVPSSVVADDERDYGFFNATHEGSSGSSGPSEQSEILPGESFKYTFTKGGLFGYHSLPHPQMKATVMVETQSCPMEDVKCDRSIKLKVELTIDGLKDAYKVGEIIDISATQKGGKKCAMPEIFILDENQKIVLVSKNNAAILCPALDTVDEHSDFGLSWNPRAYGSPIIMNQTGNYTALAEYGDMGVEEQFIVE